MILISILLLLLVVPLSPCSICHHSRQMIFRLSASRRNSALQPLARRGVIFDSGEPSSTFRHVELFRKRRESPLKPLSLSDISQGNSPQISPLKPEKLGAPRTKPVQHSRKNRRHSYLPCAEVISDSPLHFHFEAVFVTRFGSRSSLRCI